ncbi:sensor histidine kinase [Actinacidiphila yeochonensis]|uniref:sensor histidine kinase n=1 Tax=Actinacidiphila yeochonensis TaxID=89050 RepID=UPI00068D9055|nr:ATP-binding protein [Actinacidiphila yeochonensis]
MSAEDSPLPHHSPLLRTAAPAVAAAAVAGAGCFWAVGRAAAAADRPLVAGAGALAAVLVGAVVGLALSRRRLSRALRHGVDAVREEAARAQAAHAETARRAAEELETARRAVREADTRRRAAAGAETTARTALHEQTARATELEAAAARLAESVLPLAVRRVRAGEAPAAVLSTVAAPDSPALRSVLDAVVTEAGDGERLRAAVTAVCAEAAARVQALTTGMLADLRELEQRHDEQVLDDLLRLDHCTAQAGRLADSVAVLTGARTGRRWTRPIPMESVLRGALGRIHAYQRVRLHSTSAAAVAGHAAEAVMHALAELMDNACNFSAPTEDVHVYVEEAQAGVVITVEDAGRAMPDTELARARRLVGDAPLDLRQLGGPRLGLAVVGCLARRHGLRVSFRPSSRGGTGVVVLVPAALVTRTPLAADGPQEAAPEYAGGASGYAEAAPGVPGYAEAGYAGTAPGGYAGGSRAGGSRGSGTRGSGTRAGEQAVREGRPDHADGPAPGGYPPTPVRGSAAGGTAARRPYPGGYGAGTAQPAVGGSGYPGGYPDAPYGPGTGGGLPRRTRGHGLAAAMAEDEATGGAEISPVGGGVGGPAGGPAGGAYDARTARARSVAETTAGERFGAFRDAAAGQIAPRGTGRPTERAAEAISGLGAGIPSEETGETGAGPAEGSAPVRLPGRQGAGRTGRHSAPHRDAPDRPGGPAPSAGPGADGRGTAGGDGTASTGGETEP